jgi:hypothetical protein
MRTFGEKEGSFSGVWVGLAFVGSGGSCLAPTALGAPLAALPSLRSTAADFSFLSVGSLSSLGRRTGLGFCLGAVGGDGLLYVGEEVGPETVKAFSVIPSDDAGAEREPEEQPGRGGD